MFVRPFVRSSVRPSVRLLPAFLRIGSLVFFWFLVWRCEMAMPKKWRSPIFKKKFFWANLGQKLPKNRVFWTLCKIAALAFSDFWQKDRGQFVLKNGRNNFSRKIFFRRKLRIFVFWGNSHWPFSNPAFLGIGSLFFADFWHKGAKWQCLKSDGARFSKKKILGKFGPKTA